MSAVVPEITGRNFEVTPEIRRLLGIEAKSLDPMALINAILKSSVDLLWFGGIGTYIKASAEKPPPEGTGNPAFWQAAEFAKSHLAWSYFEVPTSHNVPITMPNELAESLLTLT